MALSYRTAPLAPEIPNAFARLADVLHLLRAYNYRVCEWRPIRNSDDGILGNWGAAEFCGQMLGSQAYDMLLREPAHGLSLIQGLDVFILIGRCESRYEIQDFAQSVSQRIPRCAAVIVPNWKSGHDGIRLPDVCNPHRYNPHGRSAGVPMDGVMFWWDYQCPVRPQSFTR